MMWPFKTPIVGQPVSINVDQQSPQFKKERAETRVVNLKGKLSRLQLRQQTKEVQQEIANTEEAIKRWGQVLEVALLELSHIEEGSES